MARYMGGPRGRHGRHGPEPLIASPNWSHHQGEGDQDQMNTIFDQTKDEIPDSDDFGNSSQQGQLELDSEMDGDQDNLEFEDEDGMTYDEYISGSIASFVPVHPVRVDDGIKQNGLSDNEPPPKRQRSLSIPIRYKSRFSTGMPIFEPQPLPIAYGWMVKGTAEHIEDLHLSGIPFCNKEVHSKTKIQVLGEYTWIEVTPSQEESYERFPAIYVPGNVRTWRGLKIDTSLDREDIRSITSQKMRDDNLNRQPRYPYEPTFRALESAEGATSFKEIDIVTDAETLTQLLSFITGTSSARRVKEPFRLELSTVRNTLFIQPSHKPGSSQAGPPPRKARHDPRVSAPDWAADVLGHVGTHAPKLPYSGGHYRLVRYRFGNVVLAVRVKVDFVYEHRKDSQRAGVDPLQDVQPDFIPRQDGDVAQVWRTAVKRQGLGTKPAGAGVACVRYAWQEPQDPRERMRALLPRLWFSRTPFVVDCQVGPPPGLAVREVALVNSRRWYPSYERGYQGSLRRLAGLLRHLRERTREMGGNVVLIADPVQVCFVLLKPVIHKAALPEELILKFWGPGGDEDERERRAEMDRASTPEQEQSDLTDLSDTPSLPPGSDIANVRSSQQRRSHAGAEAASSVVAGGSPTRAERQRAQGIDPVKMVKDWNQSVDNPVIHSVEDEGAAYDDGKVDDSQYDADASFDGNRSSSQGSVMVGESAQEAGFEGADTVLNDLARQMNTVGGDQESDDDRMAAVERHGDSEILRGQHSLLMADRHLTEGMHTSDDDGEWPPRPRTELQGRITNAVPYSGQGTTLHEPEARRSPGEDRLTSRSVSPFEPNPPTPPGPSDFDEDGNLIERNPRNRDHVESDSSDGNAAPRARRRRVPGPVDLSGGPHDLTASGRARLSEPNARWRRRPPVEVDSSEHSGDTSISQPDEDDAEDPTSSRAASQESADESSQDGALTNHATTYDESPTGRRGDSSERRESDGYDSAYDV